MPSPVSQRRHGDRTQASIGWLFHYRARTPGASSGDNSTVRLDLNNSPSPTRAFHQPAYGGQVKLDEEGYIVGAPDSLPRSPPALPATTFTISSGLTSATVSASTSSGASSIVRSIGSFCVTAASRNSHLEEDGTLRSTVFPGLWLDPSASLDEDFDRLLDVLRSGLDSAEHAEFVGRLQDTPANKR